MQAGESCTAVAGMLYTGGDLLTTPIKSVADCCQLCQTTAKCNYFTFDTHNSSGEGQGHHCYLKTEPTGSQMNETRWISGPPQHAPALPTLVSATTTFNVTSKDVGGGGGGELVAGSGRLFLSHWDASGAAVNHSDVAVTVTVHCSAATPETCPTAGAEGRSKLYLIDESVAASKLWGEMGSPAVPSNTQLAQLKAISELKPTPLVWKAATDGEVGTNANAKGGVVMTVEVVMPPNTAGVVTLE